MESTTRTRPGKGLLSHLRIIHVGHTGSSVTVPWAGSSKATQLSGVWVWGRGTRQHRVPCNAPLARRAHQLRRCTTRTAAGACCTCVKEEEEEQEGEEEQQGPPTVRDEHLPLHKGGKVHHCTPHTLLLGMPTAIGLGAQQRHGQGTEKEKGMGHEETYLSEGAIYRHAVLR
jgi:hypothetical protein